MLRGLLLCCALTSCCAAASEVTLNWLDHNSPGVSQGVSFGVPWPKGAVQKDQTFVLSTADAHSLPLQTWPLAFWADGSLKWSGFAAVTREADAGPFTLRPARPAGLPAERVQVKESGQMLEIDTGRLRCRIPRTGDDLVDSMVVGGRQVACKGRLICMLEDRSRLETDRTTTLVDFVGTVTEASLEQSGPVRAVVRLKGMHKAVKGDRQWLPFCVRLYFYAGQEQVRLVHTIVFDGDEQKDFIKGLAVIFTVPLAEQVQNRHVRFSGEHGGLWAEPIQPLRGRDGRSVADPNTRGDAYSTQVAGGRVPNREQVSSRSQNLLSKWAVWSDFRLIQPNPDGFTIEKRTNPQSGWLAAGAGRRASGLAFVGDVSGGLGVAIKDFWQSYPKELEVRHAADQAAELVAWLWSPEAPAMDLRHYDTVAHGLDEVYEDVQPGLSTPNGIARTSELTLYACAAVPTREETALQAQANSQPPRLVCEPRYLQSVQAFGIWGLEDRSTAVKRGIEERLDATVNYYLGQVDQRGWYGFWDFGDVMHSYDVVRHVWRYDLGGMAWDNSELATDMWLWYTFLRTGRPDVFRMAEAMTRHTAEVDCYHQGRLAGLGSRHNVRHWGCGAKEARISQAAYRRFYHYLTTDERTGDAMREMLNADLTTLEFDPMRLAQPITEAEKRIAPTRVRLGPDWLAFVSNWMTEWERTGDTRWRDKILAGVESLSKMPFGMRTGRNLVMGYDPQTARLFALNDEAGQYNLATIMGGAEVAFELGLMLDDARWHRLWDQYCRLYNAPKEVLVLDVATGTEGMDAVYARDGRLAAYLWLKTQNPAFRQAAVASLLRPRMGGRLSPSARRVEGAAALNPVDEMPMAGTNGAAQNGLETICMLGAVGQFLPAEMPADGDLPSFPRTRPGRPAGLPPTDVRTPTP